MIPFLVNAMHYLSNYAMLNKIGSNWTFIDGGLQRVKEMLCMAVFHHNIKKPKLHIISFLLTYNLSSDLLGILNSLNNARTERSLLRY